MSAKQEAMVYCTRQRTSAIGAMVEQQQDLERQLSLRLLEAFASLVKSVRDGRLFALAALHWYHSLDSHACQPLDNGTWCMRTKLIITCAPGIGVCALGTVCPVQLVSPSVYTVKDLNGGASLGLLRKD